VQSRAQLSPELVDGIIRTHGIDPEALRADDFAAHFNTRREFILDLVERATGKRVQREEGLIDAAAVAQEYEAESEPDEALAG
jgi:hypothetical protein